MLKLHFLHRKSQNGGRKEMASPWRNKPRYVLFLQTGFVGVKKGVFAFSLCSEEVDKKTLNL